MQALLTNKVIADRQSISQWIWYRINCNEVPVSNSNLPQIKGKKKTGLSKN